VALLKAYPNATVATSAGASLNREVHIRDARPAPNTTHQILLP